MNLLSVLGLILPMRLYHVGIRASQSVTSFLTPQYISYGSQSHIFHNLNEDIKTGKIMFPPSSESYANLVCHFSNGSATALETSTLEEPSSHRRQTSWLLVSFAKALTEADAAVLNERDELHQMYNSASYHNLKLILTLLLQLANVGTYMAADRTIFAFHKASIWFDNFLGYVDAKREP